jgi:predicted nucleotidyltransferase
MEEIVSRFCGGEIRGRWRSVLREVIALAKSTGRLEAAYIFGSFVTAKAAPADIDLFLVMSRDFSSNQVVGRARLLFDRSRAAIVWGICIYWITARTDRIPFLETWQLRRSGGQQGIVEVDL